MSEMYAHISHKSKQATLYVAITFLFVLQLKFTCCEFVCFFHTVLTELPE